MISDLHFDQLSWLYFIIPTAIGALVYRWFYYKPVTYQFSLVGLIRQMGTPRNWQSVYLMGFLRLILLLLLAFLMLKPQLPDKRSKTPVEGIDIMIALDLSGSMQAVDDLKVKKNRLTVAKEEAVRFINQRDDDSLGLVVFGANAISRAPLTLDKKILVDIIKDLELGNTVDPNGTVIAKSLATALNRLKDSTAKSKIVILLTDGESTHQDIQPHVALDIAKKLNIKIYCIGIGGKQGGYTYHPAFGYQLAYPPLNTRLLEYIAQETGGKCFRAKNQKEMRKIYSIIDKLEKTERETSLYANYTDMFMPILWFILAVLILSTFFSSVRWRTI